jgi:uncharacterized protein
MSEVQSTGSEARFTITHDGADTDALIAGLTEFGLAGLTAADFLVNHLELVETGYVTVEQLPEITPFEGGQPRHHTRFFSRPDLDVSVLTGELFVPVGASRPFADAVLEWMDKQNVGEVTVLSGVPIAHGPEEHRTFHVVTPDYRTGRLTEAEVPPMGNGFLDGVNASLVGRGIDTDLAAGVLLTPVHDRIPDVEAAIRLVETTADLYDLDVDTSALESLAADVERYYRELGERLANISERDRPDDRMFM